MDRNKELGIIIDCLFKEGVSQLPVLSSIDKAYFIQLCVAHRSLFHVYNSESVKSNPEYSLFLKPYVLQDQFDQLAGVNETLRINDQFKNANIPVVLLKGIDLSSRVYDSPSARMSKDTDLLVSMNYLDESASLLIKNGYEIETKLNSPKQRKCFHKYFDHYEFFNPSKGTTIELHWRVEGRSIEVIQSSLKSNTINELTFTVLEDDLNFTYVIQHAAKHDFYRLQWVYDIQNYESKISDEVKAKFIKSQDYKSYISILNYLKGNNPSLSSFERYCVSLIESNWCLEKTKNNPTIRRKVYFHKLKHDYYHGGLKHLLIGWKNRFVRPDNWSFYAFPDNVFILNHILSRPIWIIKQITRN